VRGGPVLIAERRDRRRDEVFGYGMATSSAAEPQWRDGLCPGSDTGGRPLYGAAPPTTRPHDHLAALDAS